MTDPVTKTVRYNIYQSGQKIHSNLTQDDYFDTIQDIAEQFYQYGSPAPEEITTEIIEE